MSPFRADTAAPGSRPILESRPRPRYRAQRPLCEGVAAGRPVTMTAHICPSVPAIPRRGTQSDLSMSVRLSA
jgi:hypothetical protein